MKAITDSLRGVDSEGAKMYKQLRMDGGTTGGLGLSTKKAIEINLDKMEKIQASNPRKAAEMVLEGVDNWNKVFEDS